MSSVARKLNQSVQEHYLDPTKNFTRVYESHGSEGLVDWTTQNKVQLRKDLTEAGGILLRGFRGRPEDFRKVMVMMFGEKALADSYQGGISRRYKVSENVFVSTVFPKEGAIPQHFEMSYLQRWPHFISFFCERASLYGGNTPVADGRQLRDLVGAKVMKRLRDEGVRYYRCYKADVVKGVFPTWQEAFNTSDRKVVEEFCRDSGFEFEWDRDGGLRTSNWSQGVVKHPETGEELFFNHAMLASFFSGQAGVLSPSFEGLAPALAPHLIEMVSKLPFEQVPYAAAWGKTNEPIDLQTQIDLANAFRKCTYSFLWQEGDLLILDNLLTSHGRDPFIGERKILASMASR